MIRHTILLATLCLGLATSAVAQDGGERRGPKDGPRPTLRERLERFDTNGDGQLDAAERQAVRDAVQKRRGEGVGRRGQGEGARRAALLERFDTNGDGTLDATERQAARDAIRQLRGQRGGQRRGQDVPRRRRR